MTPATQFGFLQLHSQVRIRNGEATVEPLRPPRAPDASRRRATRTSVGLAGIAIFLALLTAYLAYQSRLSDTGKSPRPNETSKSDPREQTSGPNPADAARLRTAPPPAQGSSPSSASSSAPANTVATSPALDSKSRTSALPGRVTERHEGNAPISTPLGPPSAPTADECDPVVPDREPEVRLRRGDVIVAGGGGLYRLDSSFNETTIAFGGHIERARGLAVGKDGHVYVATIACRKGAVVKVDPKSGTQSVVASGFRTPVGIAVDQDGTVLVSDENPVDGRWGQLFRFDFASGESSVVQSVVGDSVPTSIGFDSSSGEIVVASKKIYRMTRGGPRLLGFEVTNVHALTFARTGEMFMAPRRRRSCLHRGPAAPPAP